jgi:hypothetical protein
MSTGNVRWTPEARKAAQQECTDENVEQIDAAIAYAENLAQHAGSPIVNSDLWRQAWDIVARAHRIAKHNPPAQRHEIPGLN